MTGHKLTGQLAARGTSWGGRPRLRAAAISLTAALGITTAFAGPVAAAGGTSRIVVVGHGAAAALRSVGAGHVTVLGADAAEGSASTGQADTLLGRGLAVSPDAPVTLTAATAPSGKGGGNPHPAHVDARSASRLSVRSLTGASQVGDGAGQTIAVIDSGVDEVPALAGRVIQGADFTGTGFADDYGHGTFVATLAAGNGLDANGMQTGLSGVAPAARIVSVKVADASGRSTVGRVVAGLAWVIAHKADYGIGVVNMSLSVSTHRSYNFDPVDAVSEAAWFSGIAVVASAGNGGGAVLSAPGNDPYVITVGSVNDQNTLTETDDTLSPFSDSGLTQDGISKPDVTYFGQHVRAALPTASSLAAQQVISGLPAGYGQMSGTSMAAGVAAGSAAVLRANHPNWKPGQLKTAIVGTKLTKVKELQLQRADSSRPRTSADVGYHPSWLLGLAYAQGILHTHNLAGIAWSNVTWSDVTWSDVVWSDVTWSTATWSNATWSDVTWSDATWSDATWSDATWSDATWSDSVLSTSADVDTADS